jgi:hypothetical protein
METALWGWECDLDREMATLLQLDCEGVPVCFLYFNEAVGEKDGELKDEAEKEAQPEWPDVGLGIGEYDADSRHQNHHQQDVFHLDLNINEIIIDCQTFCKGNQVV